MKSTQRLRKRTAVILVVGSFLILVGLALFFALRSPATCHDSKRNQGEVGVDCGGPCVPCPEIYDPEPFETEEAAFVSGGALGEYDVLARVHNPNDELGASSVSYEFRLKDGNGTVIGSAHGTGFILPQETKTFMEIGLRVTGTPVSAEIVFSGPEWRKFSGYQEKPPMSVIHKDYRELSSGPFFGEAVGTLVNDSTYDFDAIVVRVVLRDASGKPIALNRTEINTVLSKESREFILRWPKAFPGMVSRIDVEPDVDLFDTESFFERSRSAEPNREIR